MKKMESTGKFIKRKLSEAGSIVYRRLIFPFRRMIIERKNDSILEKGVYVRGGCSFKGRDFVGENCLLENVHMGYSSMIGRDSILSNTRIGSFTCVGNAETFFGKHPVKGENISIHPAFYSTAAQFGYTYVNRNSFNEADYTDEQNHIMVDIGNDVWLGRDVKLCEGVRIADGAVVGAGSLVMKDIEPYAIYAGVPAKKIGQRFDDDKIEALLKLKWWDKDEAWLKENAEKFMNPELIFEL